MAKWIEKANLEIPCVYINLKEYEQIVRDTNVANDKELSALLKILSPQYLLKVASVNDSNSLNEKFYQELLHIIGLEEVKEGGKNIIRRKKDNIESASLIEMALKKIKTKGIHKIADIKNYGDNAEEQYFHIALELCIVWINRILFLKLLEGQLMSYHYGNKDYCFLNKSMIPDFNELFDLFHNVLAVNIGNRDTEIADKYTLVPYLNSSLFEISDIEDLTICIDSLDNTHLLALMPHSILKDTYKSTKALPPLDYLFSFLDAYDFASEGTEEVQEDNKNLINASVLGKVFEKINGYKDGSIFTPAFITMYMCRESIRLAVIEKFNEALSPKGEKMFETFDDVKSYTFRNYKAKDILICNKIINSLHICDPAVGSGHFLVSALNEIISIKAELGILANKNGFILRDYEIEIVNDELIITDFKGNIVEYRLKDGKPLNKEMQNVQETLFYEKQNIIESCLFGVDINPNSVKICRLRLWIELLKNAYYKADSNYLALETLPNIDINIKCGNSLLSRFALDADLSKALKSIKYDIKAYRGFVQKYKQEKNKSVKRVLQQVIDDIKKDFRTEIHKNDPKLVKLHKLSGDLFNLLNQTLIFDLSAKEKKAQKEKQSKLESEIVKLTQEVDEVKSNAIYKNAFEWRFEFPEILSDDGNFLGFDVIVGNPPYIQLQSMGKDSLVLENANYKTYIKGGDIYSLFYEKGNELLKQNGVLAYITSNKWMRTEYGLNTRKYLVEHTNPLLLIDFGMVLVFDNAMVLSNVLIFQKTANTQQLLAVRTPNNYDIKTDLKTFFQTNYTKVSFNEHAWIIQERAIQTIKTKIEKQGIALKDWNITINRGILTGYNEAFIIDKNVRDRLIAEHASAEEVIKPILRGQDIKAWQPAFADLWLIYIPWHFPLHEDNTIQGVSVKAENKFKEDYPSIYNHLLKFKTNLQKRNQAETGIRYEWYALQRFGSNYWKDFQKPKIIYPNMTKFLPFVYDEKGFVTNQKCFIVTSKDDCLKYLTAFFNSTLFKFCFKDNFPELLGNTFELSKVFFEQIPVKQISIQAQAPFIELVDKVLAAKAAGSDISEIEKQIDALVYQLYDISAEEQAVIEKGV